jgi:hypothetical protein
VAAAPRFHDWRRTAAYMNEKGVPKPKVRKGMNAHRMP